MNNFEANSTAEKEVDRIHIVVPHYKFLHDFVRFFRTGSMEGRDVVFVAMYGQKDQNRIEIEGLAFPESLKGLREVFWFENAPRLCWRDSSNNRLYELPSIAHVADLAAEGFQ